MNTKKTLDTPPIIELGSEVEMHFKLLLTDGTLVESSEETGPIRFIMGDGSLTPGLEAAICGLRAGEHQSLTIEAGLAFDMPDPDKVYTLNREEFGDADLEFEVGQVVEFEAPNGEEVVGTVVVVEDHHIDVDFNHPLAGRTIQFDVDIVEVIAPTGEKVRNNNGQALN
jgi:FKBP-type peptidyl-prolyl cis-trans isomerase SlpA